MLSVKYIVILTITALYDFRLYNFITNEAN